MQSSFFLFLNFSFSFKFRQSRYQLHWSLDPVHSCCIWHEINSVKFKKEPDEELSFLVQRESITDARNCVFDHRKTINDSARLP